MPREAHMLTQPLYGFFPPYTSGQRQGPWFRSVSTASGAPLYVAEDEEVDFDKILEQGPTVGVGRGVGWHAHWLAIEGIQPPVPENPVFLARQAAGEALTEADEAAVDLGNTAVKPLVKHVLSRELQLYYERLTSSILSPPTDAKAEENTALPMDDAPLNAYAEVSSGNLVRDAALASLRGDAGIHQLVPYLIQWVGSNVTHTLRAPSEGEQNDAERTKTVQLLHTMLSTLHALLTNPSIFIEPYVCIGARVLLTTASPAHAVGAVDTACLVLWRHGGQRVGRCTCVRFAGLCRSAPRACHRPLCRMLPNAQVARCGDAAPGTAGAHGRRHRNDGRDSCWLV